MSKDLELLDNFVEDMAAKGIIQIGVYLNLKEAIYRLEDKEYLPPIHGEIND